MGGEPDVGGGPARPEFDLGAVTLLSEFAESGRQDPGRSSGWRCVGGTTRVEGVDEPGPGDLGQERVDDIEDLIRRADEVRQQDLNAIRLRR